MSSPDQYRRLNNADGDTDGNASTPVFDPVLASGQADAEAGGASPLVQSPAPPAPDRRTPEAGQTGLRLPMRLWLAVAAAILAALIAAAILL